MQLSTTPQGTPVTNRCHSAEKNGAARVIRAAPVMKR